MHHTLTKVNLFASVEKYIYNHKIVGVEKYVMSLDNYQQFLNAFLLSPFSSCLFKAKDLDFQSDKESK